MDRFSRLVVTSPPTNATSEEIIDNLIASWLLRFELLMRITTDQDTQLRSHYGKIFCLAWELILLRQLLITQSATSNVLFGLPRDP